MVNVSIFTYSSMSYLLSNALFMTFFFFFHILKDFVRDRKVEPLMHIYLFHNTSITCKNVYYSDFSLSFSAALLAALLAFRAFFAFFFAVEFFLPLARLKPGLRFTFRVFIVTENE